MADIFQTLADKIGGTRIPAPGTGDFPTVIKDTQDGWHIEMTGSPGDAGSSNTTVSAKYLFDDGFLLFVRQGDVRFKPPKAKKLGLSKLSGLLRNDIDVWGTSAGTPRIEPILKNIEVSSLLQSAALHDSRFEFVEVDGGYDLSFKDQNHGLEDEQTLERYVAAFQLVECVLKLVRPSGPASKLA